MKAINDLLGYLPTIEIKTLLKKGVTYYVARHNSSDLTRVSIKAINYVIEHPLRTNTVKRLLDHIKESPSSIEWINHLDEAYAGKFKRYASKIANGDSLSEKLNEEVYCRLVLYVYIKLLGSYQNSFDKLFGVTYKHHREYNPLTNAMSVLRGNIGLEIYEYDIRAAVPSFIDQLLNTDHRYEVYDKIGKQKFAMMLNMHEDCEQLSYDQIISELSIVYDNRIMEVLTEEVYSKKGCFAELMNEIEEKAINEFVKENGITNYIRCHDGIYTLQRCDKLLFDKIEFKETKLLPLEQNEHQFYTLHPDGKVETSATLYKEFLCSQGFKRVRQNGDDDIRLIFSMGNVTEFFPYKTELVSFVKKFVLEPEEYKKRVWDQIARDQKSKLSDALQLMESKPIEYHSDQKDSIVIPFRNELVVVKADGFRNASYISIPGYFSKTASVDHEFCYTSTVGDFEQFVFRSSTNSDEFDPNNTTFQAFCSMIGYLLSTFKDPTLSKCIVLSDENATEENRKGRRGKSLIMKGIEYVRKTMYKGGKDFNPTYNHYLSDLDESYRIYQIDDVPAGFNYHDLFTLITGDISSQKKGKNAVTIPFKLAPKFIVTTNYIFRYDEEDTSIKARFQEYKFSDYYNDLKTPMTEFNKAFFSEDWRENDWNEFYSFLIRCCQVYLKDGLIALGYDKRRDNAMVYCNEYNYDIIRKAIMDYSDQKPTVISCMGVYEYLQRHPWMRDVHRMNVKRYIEAFLESDYNDLGKFERRSDKKYYRI